MRAKAARPAKSCRAAPFADWDPAWRGHDALATILGQNEFRAPDLIPIRHGRMAASPWTYFRGAAAVPRSVRAAVGGHADAMRKYATVPEIDIWYDRVDVDEPIGQLAPCDAESLGASHYPHNGQRVINGQRMIQSATDMFVGWTTNVGKDFYVRQFRDGKVIPKGGTVADRSARFAAACRRVLARAHARSGDAAAIADYLGTSASVETAFIAFACADQNQRDHAQLAGAVADGSIPGAVGWG